MEPVGIEGWSAIAAAGASPEAILEQVLVRRSAVRADPALAQRGFRSAMVARLPAIDDARWLRAPELAAPRVAQLVLCAARMALDDAGVDPERLGDAALVLGTSSGGMNELAAWMRAPDDAPAREGTYFAPGALVARALGIRGPCQTVSAACASGALAMALAADQVAARRCDLAIAVGYDLWCDFVHAGFDALGALTDRVPTPFRADRAGLVLGEGAGAVILSRGPGRRGRLLGVGMSGDARHITAPDRTGAGVARAIRTALADARLSAEDLDLVSAHGTGTVHNDAMESRALEDALGARAFALPVHSIKPIIGHTLGAAGLLESVVSLAALGRGVAPPTLTSDVLDPACRLDYTTAGPVGLSRARTLLKLSSGFGGSNAALVLGAP